jgi:hypothetical protein
MWHQYRNMISSMLALRIMPVKKTCDNTCGDVKGYGTTIHVTGACLVLCQVKLQHSGYHSKYTWDIAGIMDNKTAGQ